MKITLKTSEVLDALYADSALTSIAMKSPENIVAYVLSPEQELALRRMVRDATVATIALAPDRWAIDRSDEAEIVVEAPESVDFDLVTTAELLRVAVTAMMQYLIYRLGGNNCDTSLSIAESIMKNLSLPRYFTTKLACS